MKCRPTDTGGMEQQAAFQRRTLSRADMDAVIAARRAIADRKSFEEASVQKSSTSAQFSSYVQFGSGRAVEVRQWAVDGSHTRKGR